MTDKVTDLEAFKRDKNRRAAADDRDQAVADQHAALQDLLDETARTVQALDQGMDRALARALARGEVGSRDSMRELAQRYERLSWRLCGQLRYILDKGRKG